MGVRGSWRRWRVRVVASVVLLTLLGLFVAAIFTYLSYRDAAAQLIIQRDRQVSLLTAIRLRDELAKLADDLGPMARSQSLYLGLTEKQRLLLRGQGQRLSVFDGGLVLMDNTGRVRATAPERWDIMSQDWSNQEFFRNMLVAEPPSEYFSSVVDIGPDKSSVVVVSVPVLGPNGEMAGVLAGLFRLGESQVSAFYASIVRLRLTGSGNTFIVDGAGRIIYDSGYQRTGQLVDAEVLRNGIAGNTPAQTLDADGNQVIASYAEVPGTSWTLISETDWSQAMAPVERFATGIVVLLALGMIVPTVGVALLARGQRSLLSDGDQAALIGRTSKALRERLLPQYTPMLGGWEVAVHHHAAAGDASAVDLYDYMLLPDGQLMISLATIADRGLSALHLMTTARAAFRTAASSSSSAGRALSLCNNLICPDVGPDTAITALYAMLDPASGLLQIANAGFCAPFRWSAGDLVEMREGVDFLGQAPDVEFDHDDILLGPGDAIIFYSPGALGIQPETGAPFGPERVRQVLNASAATTAQEIIDAMRADLSEFADARSLRRLDISLLVLARGGTPQPQRRARRSIIDDLGALNEPDMDL